MLKYLGKEESFAIGINLSFGKKGFLNEGFRKAKKVSRMKVFRKEERL